MTELFIPTRIQKDNVFGKGFGKAEMRRLVVVSIVGLLLGFLVGLLFFSNNFQQILIASVSVMVLFSGCGYFVFLKNSINLSVYHYMLMFKDFLTEQRMYKYKKLKEWGNG